MADQLPYNFTDVEYLTPRGVRRALNTSLIDGIWAKVVAYRQPHMKTMGLRTAGSSPYRYCATEVLSKKYDAFLDKISLFRQQFESLSPEAKVDVRKTLRFNALKQVALHEKIKVSDYAIKAIVNKMYREEDPSASILLGYDRALSGLEDDPYQTPNEEFLVKEFETLYRTDELVSFYRQGASNESFTKAQVGAIIVPSSDQVPILLDGLHRFLNTDPTPTHLKSALAMLLLYGIVPFENNNFTMSCLYGKNQFGSLLGESAALLPLENIIQEGSPSFQDIFTQSLKSGDATYMLTYAIKVISENIDVCLDLFTRAKTKEVAKEYVALTKEETPPQEIQPPEKEEIVEVKPVVKEKILEEAPKQEEEVETISSLPVSQGEMAVKAPRVSLSDKEVKETAKYLRESHPTLTKGQCLFYASHCTMGRYYSISDFKKTIRCAYETARTSMDKLASEGFYKKYRIKNKFVYTPIKQGENKQ